MSKSYSDIDEMIKDISGPNSKFYKDWMKGKALRERYIREFVSKLLARAEKEREKKPKKVKTKKTGRGK